MEYLRGGDLMTLFINKDILSETEARFYIAEIILAVESVHEMHYIHRDLKPDNILIDANGHLKLSDFGLCAKFPISHLTKTESMINNIAAPIIQTNVSPFSTDYFNTENNSNKKQHRDRKLLYSTVGTSDYIAPEIFEHKGYTETVDYWAIGVILFEMVVGYPPFYSEKAYETCQKILNWKDHFKIPEEANLSNFIFVICFYQSNKYAYLIGIGPELSDLINKFIAEPENRLGVHGINEIKAHPFFKSIDWQHIRNGPAPFVPTVRHIIFIKLISLQLFYYYFNDIYFKDIIENNLNEYYFYFLNKFYHIFKIL